MKKDEPETVYLPGRQEWRNWLKENHDKKESVWLIYYKKNSGIPSLTWSEAVDEALCFGWIDSKRKPLDGDRFLQFFCKRRAGSTWSKINKEKVKLLTEQGLMTQAGLDCIETAMRNGSWNILDKAEELLIPEDLEKAFEEQPGSKDYFLSLSKSDRRNILHWIVLAKRPETRQKRIKEAAELAGKSKKPNVYGMGQKA